MQQELERAKKHPKISVVIRKRPLSQKELAKNEIDIIEKRGNQTIIVKELKQKVDLTKYIEEHNFNFDYAFGEQAQNQEIYQSVIQPLVSAIFTNATCTCFAYGQTGSGKTHTMLGNFERGNPGLYLLASDDLFKCLLQPQYQHLSVWISFYEIYCGKLFDLLNDRQELHVREDAKKRVNIVGLSEKKIQNVQNIMNIIEFGNKVRVTGVNSANSESSRSHAILSITVRENNNTYGKLSFIDLAGSERGADVSDSNKQTRIDGAEINKSLLALKECIRAIDQNKNHTPFRGSKLTQVLRDSFVGNCKTVMIGNISPSQASSENTLNTLRYADRVKELKKPSTNQLDQSVSELDKFSKELMLPRQGKNVKRYSVPNENASIDYTKQGNPGQQQPQQQQQQQQDQGNSVFNANGQLNLNNNSGLNLNNNNNLNSANNNNNNQNNNVMNNLQKQFTKKRVSQPQTQNLFGNTQQNPDSNNQNNNQNNQNNAGGAGGVGAMDLNSLMQQRQNNYNNNQNNNNNSSNNLINNTTNNVNVMNNNNLNQLNQMNGLGGNNNNSYTQMEQEVPYQKQPQQYQQNSNPNLLNNNNFGQQQQPQLQQNGSAMFQNNSSNLNLNKKVLQNSDTNQVQQNNFMQNPSNATTAQSINPSSNNSMQFNNQNNNNNFGNNNNQNNNNFSKENNAISMNIEQIKNWSARNEEDLQMISQKHEQLISLILAEEEDVISGHRGHIDDMVDLVKQEMMLLHEVDKPGSDVDEYVTNLDSILAHKVELISNLRGRLKTFKDHLKEEETLSKKFYEQRSQILDVFDLNQQNNTQNNNNNNDEMQLLDDL